MASRDDGDREHPPPSRWEGEAPRTSRPQGAEPWRRESAYTPTGDEGRGPGGPHTGGWGSAQAERPGPLPGADAPAAAYGGAAYGSGQWSGSPGPQAPSGYSGPSGTGYGQTCPGQSGYGQGESGHDSQGGGVSYAGTAGYAGYAGARPSCGPGAPAPGHTDRPRPDWYDLDYQQWRDEQLRRLDHDYQAWRQARYRQFADEFNAWRASRQDAVGTAGSEAASSADPHGGSAASGPPTPSSSQPK